MTNKVDILKKLRLSDPYFLPAQMFSEPTKLIDRLHQIIPFPDIICEVGSWLGSSLLAWCRANPQTVCCAVDTWLGSSEHYEEPLFYAAVPDLYRHFLTHTRECEDQIVPVRLSSVAAAELFRNRNIKFDIVYLDAGHSTDEVLLDLKVYSGLLTENGIVCGDDWTWESVREAVYGYAAKNRLAVETFDNSWVLV